MNSDRLKKAGTVMSLFFCTRHKWTAHRARPSPARLEGLESIDNHIIQHELVASCDDRGLHVVVCGQVDLETFHLAGMANEGDPEESLDSVHLPREVVQLGVWVGR